MESGNLLMVCIHPLSLGDKVQLPVLNCLSLAQLPIVLHYARFKVIAQQSPSHYDLQACPVPRALQE